MSIAGLERTVFTRRQRCCRDRRLRTLAPLVVDDGCDVRIQAGHHADGVRVALLEWLPPTGVELAAIDDGRRVDPALVLASLVRPPTVWATFEAIRAARRVDREDAASRERDDALLEYAVTQLGEHRLERLHRVAARFVQRLPLEGRPDLSDMLAAGCSLVANDDDICAAVAAVQLVRYTSSALVARRRREAAPTMT